MGGSLTPPPPKTVEMPFFLKSEKRVLFIGSHFQLVLYYSSVKRCMNLFLFPRLLTA